MPRAEIAPFTDNSETVHRAPPMIWISWCDACGKPDYAYASYPDKKDLAGCPRCETGGEYQKIAGPYLSAPKRKPRSRGERKP